MHINDVKGKRLHLIGIGGCSMNGLAQILLRQGYEVSGSDKTESPFTRRLQELGIRVSIGHAEENVSGCDLVVYSAAIKPDNPERAYARALGVPEMERSVLLGQISSQYGTVVGIAGCHGKTTITSMLAKIFDASRLDATVHIGGFVDFLEGGTRVGSSDLFVSEACEYVESFLTLSPTIALISNIDDDHLDYFRDINHIVSAFEKFLSRLPDDGVFIGCTDDARVRKLIAGEKRRVITYGMESGDYFARNITSTDGCCAFECVECGKSLGEVKLAIPGKHNVANALGAIATARLLGVDFGPIAAALGEYRLTRRRFEYYGQFNGVKVVHDYAHHPAEIRACLQTALGVPHGKLYIVFQCNSYTRAKTLFTGDMQCFKGADEVFVPDIFPGREVDTGIVHARDMVSALERSGIKARYIPTFEGIRDELRAIAKPGDLVVTLGSGDVYIQTKIFLEEEGSK